LPSHNIIIREAREADVEALVLLLTQLGYPQDPLFVLRKLEEFHERSSSKVFVAEIGDRVVGFLSFDSEPAFHKEGRIGTIMALCVLEECRGQGIGHKLVAEAEAEAIRQGCVRLAVSSGVQRINTHQFYRNLGYEEKTKRFVKDF